MNVYYIDSGLRGCYYVRCLLPLQANGWDGDQTSIKVGAVTADNKGNAIRHADVLVYHRPDEPHKLESARMFKALGKKIVFDNDDTYHDDGGFKFNKFMDKERGKMNMAKMSDTLDEFIKEADLVTCSTEFLAEEYRKLNPNVIVLPNCVDPFYYDDIKKNEGEQIRIGITGSLAITSDLDLLMPIIEHFHKKSSVRLVVFSMPPDKDSQIYRELYDTEYNFFESVNIEWQPFVPMEQYVETLNNLKLDLMIIPRADNYFNRCKSNLKFLEASMLEIPCIASGFPDGKSPYEVNPKDAEHMVMVKDPTKWIETIEKVISDREAMREQGKKARKYVEENYSIDKHGHKWADAYETMYETKR